MDHDDRPVAGIQPARHLSRARLRWRRAGAAGTSVLAAAAVAVLTVGTGPAAATGRATARQTTAGAPRRFSPLVPYISFGWLPAGKRLVAGDLRPELQALTAGRSFGSPADWDLLVYAGGQCHLGGRPAQLTCSTAALEGLTVRIGKPAPEVLGHRAFWAGPYLVWRYARGGWAALALPIPALRLATPAQIRKARRQALRIAANVKYGAATPPLLFPVQLRHLPRLWRVASVFYEPDGRVFRALRFSLGTGHPDLGADGGLEYQTNLPYFSTIEPAASLHHFCFRYPGSVVKIINGVRVILSSRSSGTLTSHDLCAAHARGLALFVSQFGTHPPVSLAALFGGHLRLLGPRPAGWTRKPVV